MEIGIVQVPFSILSFQGYQLNSAFSEPSNTYLHFKKRSLSIYFTCPWYTALNQIKEKSIAYQENHNGREGFFGAPILLHPLCSFRE